jgi:hypothetical protein
VIDWTKYYLKDIPFVEFASIKPDSKDDRINGKIFSILGMESEYRKLLDLIKRERGICYVRSDLEVLGTGKSALMAAVYWHCKNDAVLKKSILPAWVNVQDFRSITQLMGKVLDTLVFEQVTDLIKARIEDLSPATIDNFLSSEKPQRSPSVIFALSKILSMPKEELPWKYVNIRRSISTVSAVEIFEYLMVLFRKVDPRRVLIFIDQFEEYVKYQRGAARLEQLGNDVNDIIRAISECRNLSFVLTLHPTTQREFEKSAGPLIESFGTIMENAATVSQLKPDHLIEMAKLYIKHFRMPNAPKDIGPVYPFENSALEYIAQKSGGIPRIFIRFLHNAMIEAAIANQDRITLQFIKQPMNLSRIGIVD